MAGTALYQKIADDLRRQITSGERAPGDQLPTQEELVKQYGTARMTVRQAIAQLVNEGLVTSQRGKGLTVRNRQRMIYRPQQEREPRISRGMDRYMASLTAEGRKPSQKIEVAVVQATPEVARRLEIEPGEIVVARKRVRWIDGEPFNINDTFYPYELAKDTEIMSPADIPRGSNYVLNDKGYFEVRAVDEFYVRMPEPEEASRLALGPGTPVVIHYTTGYTESDQPIRCEYHVLPGDRHVILYERVHPADTPDYAPDDE